MYLLVNKGAEARFLAFRHVQQKQCRASATAVRLTRTMIRTTSLIHVMCCEIRLLHTLDLAPLAL